MKQIYKSLFIAVGLVFLLVLPFQGKAFQLSQQAEVSVLTCGPSKQLHALYGHTAIRVNDPRRMFDVVFNYGVFSFNAPNFVYRFAKGQTDYMLAPEKYEDFLISYQRDGRNIYEQVLNLTQQEKQQLVDFLIWNAKPENREYRYNFFMDNCATRVRDVVMKQVDGDLIFPENEGLEMTFREHVDDYQRVLPWINFGINLTLGRPSDLKASVYHEMFLPDFLMKHFAHTQIRKGTTSRPLVKETRTIFDAGKTAGSGFSLLTPEWVLGLLLLVVIVMTYKQYRAQRASYWIDYSLLILTGLIGVVLVWFVTCSEHPAMKANLNLLWAVPTNLIFAFLWLIKAWRPALTKYWKALAVWLILFLVGGFIIEQDFHVGFYLLTLMVLCRALLHGFLLKSVKEPKA